MMPTMSPRFADTGRRPVRRTISSGLLLQRIRAEFLEMPGLTLTLPQAARLWGLTPSRAEALLTELVARGFLTRGSHDSYRRRGCPRCS
jgi:Fic family protein